MGIYVTYGIISKTNARARVCIYMCVYIYKKHLCINQQLLGEAESLISLLLITRDDSM